MACLACGPLSRTNSLGSSNFSAGQRVPLSRRRVEACKASISAVPSLINEAAVSNVAAAVSPLSPPSSATKRTSPGSSKLRGLRR